MLKRFQNHHQHHQIHVKELYRRVDHNQSHVFKFNFYLKSFEFNQQSLPTHSTSPGRTRSATSQTTGTSTPTPAAYASGTWSTGGRHPRRKCPRLVHPARSTPLAAAAAASQCCGGA